MNENYLDNIEDRPDIFPCKWHRELDSFDVALSCSSLRSYGITGNVDTKSRLNSSYWKKPALKKMMGNDNWNVKGQMIICVWDINQKESDPPIGFTSFDISRLETRTKRVSELFLTVNLIWVNPSKRSLGGNTARHVVSHLIAYLEDCNFTKEIVASKGMDVYYHAELHSSGGGTLSKVIEGNLSYMKDCGAWKMKNLELDAGF
jgi:hypothetical protein